jgi:hypothetical protein
MTRKTTDRARRMAELLETAEGLHRSGLMTSTDYDKIHGQARNKIERLQPPS